MTVAEITEEVAAALRPLGPVHVTKEGGPYQPGICVRRLTRSDLPSREYPYRGTLVTVMYAPGDDFDTNHAEWAERAREVLTTTFPDRFRPMPIAGTSTMLIEDPGTAYAQWRAGENAKRLSLGFKPLHEIEEKRR